MQKGTCENKKCFDYVIVGGGIAGLYCAMKLLEQHPRSTIGIFEKSNRLGGKIETFRFDPERYKYHPARTEPDSKTLRKDERAILKEMVRLDEMIVAHDGSSAEKANSIPSTPANGRKIQKTLANILGENDQLLHERLLKTLLIADFGPMRIEPEYQPLLSELLSDLGFKKEDPACPTWSDLVPFSPFSGEPPSGLTFPLEGEEKEQSSSLDLLLLAFRRVFENIDQSRPISDPLDFDPRGNNTTGKEAGGHDQIEGESKDVLGDALGFLWREIISTDPTHRQYWKRNIRNWINCLHDGHYRYIRRHFSYKGTPLRDMGLWNLVASVLSHLATLKLRDYGSFYHLLGNNPNAAEWLIFWLRNLRTSDSLVSIRGGMDLLVEKLCIKKLGITSRELNREEGQNGNLHVFFKHQLLKVEELVESTYRVRLFFHDYHGHLVDGERTSCVYAKHVILALPRGPLQRLIFREVPYERVRKFDHILDSVKPIPLLKCFALFDRPFWEDDRPANRFADTVPTRELHYWKNKSGSAGLIMLYMDDPGHEFWSNYIKNRSVELRVDGKKIDELALLVVPDRSQNRAEIHTWERETKPTSGKLDDGWRKQQLEWEHGQVELLKFGNGRLLRTFLSYAREGGAASTPESSMLAVGIRDWSLKPAEGATHYWRPGIDSETVMNYLSGFSLLEDKGGTGGPLHVCGEAYSDYHGFIEGALRSVQRVLWSLEKTKQSEERSDYDEEDECAGRVSKDSSLSPRVVRVTYLK